MKLCHTEVSKVQKGKLLMFGLQSLNIIMQTLKNLQTRTIVNISDSV
jgi:hypothetical protein